MTRSVSSGWRPSFVAGGVEVEIIAADLGDRAQLAVVEHRLRDAERPVEVLVNNAGFSINQRFVGGDIEAEQSLIDVMVTAVMRLCSAAAPGMVDAWQWRDHQRVERGELPAVQHLQRGEVLGDVLQPGAGD